jgi:hypothetical protein
MESDAGANDLVGVLMFVLKIVSPHVLLLVFRVSVPSLFPIR